MSGPEKGYVQFRCRWEQAPPPAAPMLDELRRWRDRLHRLGLVGIYPDGIGFGNLSCRPAGSDSFVITGTGTGHFPTLAPEQLTEVVACDLANNWLVCRGPAVASSESLSHVAVYRSAPAAAAVIHVHHAALWERLHGRVPTTAPEAEAGTPAMAFAIERLFQETEVSATGLFVMGGHRDGLMSFGRTMEEAGRRLLEACAQSAGPDTG